LSALGEVPLRQGVAVTGSVSQAGDVQAVGGATEKIEGFFDVCAARGLTGDQGVIIPASNVQHLMLRDDVVQAVEAGSFHVWPVSTIDEAMAIMSGLEAGERGRRGSYPAGSFNRRVEDRLRRLGERRREAHADDP
jgi:predicted ATP-dependent protease